MTLECRCFNDSGITAVAAALQTLRSQADGDLPADLITDPTLSDPVGGTLAVPKGGLATRWELGIWLYRELERAVTDAAVLRRSGLWTWLACYLFPLVRPTGTKVYEDARYILKRDNFRRRYRHLVAGPYYVFLAHNSAPQVVRGVLATPPYAPGDLYEQFAARQELITSGAVMDAVTTMYVDRSNGGLKRGAGANARRLAEVLMQYDVTYDFATIATDHLIDLLPREFRRFTRSS